MDRIYLEFQTKGRSNIVTDFRLYDPITRKVLTWEEVRKDEKKSDSFLKDKDIIIWNSKTKFYKCCFQFKVSFADCKIYSVMNVVKNLMRNELDMSLERVARHLDIPLKSRDIMSRIKAIEAITNVIIEIIKEEDLEWDDIKNYRISENYKFTKISRLVHLAFEETKYKYKRMELTNEEKLEEDTIAVLNFRDMIKEELGNTGLGGKNIMSELTYESILALQKYKRINREIPWYTDEMLSVYTSPFIQFYTLEYGKYFNKINDLTKTRIILLSHKEYVNYIQYGNLPLYLCHELFSQNIDESELLILSENYYSPSFPISFGTVTENPNIFELIVDGFKVAEVEINIKTIKRIKIADSEKNKRITMNKVIHGIKYLSHELKKDLELNVSNLEEILVNKNDYEVFLETIKSQCNLPTNKILKLYY